MTELKVFSPSSTVTFSKCPRRWAIDKAGWKSRLIEYPELCAILGNGFGKAMEIYNLGLKAGEVHRSEVLIARGIEEMEAELAHNLDAGRRLAAGQEPEFREKLPMLLEKAVDLYMKVDPLQGWTILEAEHTYEAFGNARLDLLASDSEGPAVLDYKLKVKLEEKWKVKELDKHAKGWQRPHYMWMTGVKRFYIILVVLGPKPYIKLEQYEPTPYELSGLWGRDAKYHWAGMMQYEGAPLELVPGSASHVDEWGDCPHQAACLDFALDPARMAVKYVQVPKRKEKV